MKALFHVREIISHHIAKRLNAGAETAYYRGDLFVATAGGMSVSGDNAKVAEDGDFQGFANGVYDNNGAYNSARVIGCSGIAYAKTSAVNAAVAPLFAAKTELANGLVKLECANTTGIAVQAGLFQSSDTMPSGFLRHGESSRIVWDFEKIVMDVDATKGILQFGVTDTAIAASPVLSPATNTANGVYIEVLKNKRARLVVRKAGANIYASNYFLMDMSHGGMIAMEFRYTAGVGHNITVKVNHSQVVGVGLNTLPALNMEHFIRVGHLAAYAAEGTPVYAHLRGVVANCFANPAER